MEARVGVRDTSMPMTTRDLNSRFLSTERNSGVAIEKSAFSMVPRCSAPSEARPRRSSVFPRATVEKEKGGA